MREVVVTAEQGLIIGGPAEIGFNKPTLEYVPGSVLRGALASAWIREYGRPTAGNLGREEFIELFEGAIRYGPLLQKGTTVVPLSAVTCKYPRREKCEEWSADASVDEVGTLCPYCHQGVKTGKGQIEGVKVRRTMRAALDSRGMPKDGHLFARHELVRELTYEGRLSGGHLFLTQDHSIWLGGKTSTSGKATVRIGATDVPPDVPPSQRDDGALVVKFTSPALIVDAAGRPVLDPIAEILRVLQLGPDACGETQRWIRPVQVGGWNSVVGIPKPTETGIAMGSVVVLHLTEQPDQQALVRLASEGVGLRRVEGFGMVEINPPRWRRVPPVAITAPVSQPALLAQVRDLRLLDDEETVRWLLDRTRQVALASKPDFEPLFKQRVAIYFDDAQADAVRDLFRSPRLAAIVALLEQELDALTLGGRS